VPVAVCGSWRSLSVFAERRGESGYVSERGGGGRRYTRIAPRRCDEPNPRC
jgi:hypothetical protein